MKYPILNIFIVLIISSVSLLASNKGLIEVSAQVDTSVITIGDRITYSIIIDRQKDLKIARPGEGLNLGMFEIKSYNFPDPVLRDDRVIEEFDFEISVYDTGKYSIPPFPVAYFPKDTSAAYSIIEAPAIDIYVKSVLSGEDAGELRDVKAPLSVPFNYFFWISMAAIALLLLFSAWLIYYLIKKRREKGYMFSPPPPPRPAHELALSALEELYKSDLLEQGQYKEFFSRLSEILRVYLEGRYYFSALEETSDQILKELKNHLDQDELIDLTRRILTLSDLAKFAKYKPGSHETEPVKEHALRFVNETKIVFEAAPVEKSTQEPQPDITLTEPVSQNQISGGV